MDQLQVVAVAPSYQACWEHDRQRWARNRTVTLKGVRPDSAERAESKTPVGGRPGNFSGKHDPLATTPHETMFDSARGEERLANHTTTLAHEYARQGRDWEEALCQRA